MMESQSVEQQLMEDSDTVDLSQPPLDERILSIIRSCKDYTIRPARLATDLGISVNDACAELCGLLSAVGGGHGGASFTFEQVEHGPPTMVFTFPPDFERKARATRRKQDMYQTLNHFLWFLLKLLKILTALGLVLSLLILTVAGIIATIAVIIAMSRSGGSDHDRASMFRRVRSMIFTMRQLLWCYAMFGHHVEGQDPFLSEIAYDASLCFSLCCGNPASFWFWMRAGQLNQRRARVSRGWARVFGRDNTNTTDTTEGVALVQRGRWGRDEGRDEPSEDEHRGLLSVAVEFLFGPIPVQPGPSEPEKWKLRGAVILEHATKRGSSSLQELGPYTELPANSLADDATMVTSGLAIVAHFNGVPKQNDFYTGGKARFVFPELVAESSHVTQYDDYLDMDDGSFEYILYTNAITILPPRRSALPSFLQERRFRLTQLQSKQFFHCLGLGALNWIGVVWLRQSLRVGGVLEQAINGGPVVAVLLRWLCPVLIFYANLFFALPIGRFGVVLALNSLRERRNRRRADLAEALRTLGE
jgi:hypothetical protein